MIDTSKEELLSFGSESSGNENAVDEKGGASEFSKKIKERRKSLRQNHGKKANNPVPVSSTVKKQYERLKQAQDEDPDENDEKSSEEDESDDDGDFGGVADIDVEAAFKRAQEAEKKRIADEFVTDKVSATLRKWITNACSSEGEGKNLDGQKMRSFIRGSVVFINLLIIICMLAWTMNAGKHRGIPAAPLGLKDLCSPVALEMGDTKPCEKACHPGSCCLNDSVSKLKKEGCYVGNEKICVGYTYCENLMYHFEENGIEPAWGAKTIDMPPASIRWDCELDDNGVYVDEQACLEHCQPVSCCFELSNHLSCLTNNESACAAYKPYCSHLPREGFLADYDGSIPPPPNSLGFVCSKESIEQSDENYEMCVTFCAPALCCIGQGVLANCDDPDHETQCEQYATHCKRVWPYSDVLAQEHSQMIEKYDVPSPLADLCSEEKHTWDASGNNYCLQACSYGECCWANGDKNCEEEFAPVCAEYHSCPKYQNSEEKSSNYFVPDPPSPIEELCSISAVLTDDGLKACADACSKASCCFDSRSNNCADELAICELYQPCKYLPAEQKQFNTFDVRPPVDEACSEQSLRDPNGRNLCKAICEPALCCFDNPPYNCFEDNPSRCREYDACRSMTVVPPAPSDISILCSDDVLSTRGLNYLLCEDACKPGNCCNEPEPGNCYRQNGATCKGYEPCTNIQQADGFDTTQLKAVCAVDNLGADGGGIDCANECAPASCCFKTGSESCFDTHPYFCEAYSPYCAAALAAEAIGWIKDDEETVHIQEELNDDYYEYNDDTQDGMDALHQICSKENIMTEEGRKECEDECLLVACCLAEGEFSCFDEKEEYCETHVDLCEILDDDQGSKISFAPLDLEDICAADNIISTDGLKKCEETCAPSKCCFARGGSNCSKLNKAECDSYVICGLMGYNF